MYDCLYKYFSLYKHITIPGIGTFTAGTENARLDFTAKLIYPSIPLISYTAEKIAPERKLFSFLSSHLQVDEVNAIRKFNDFAGTLKEELNTNGTIILPGIGKLIKQFSDTFTFLPEQDVAAYYPVLTAERVLRKNAEHTVRVGEDEKTSTEMHEQLNAEEVKKERWWIAAVILTTIAIGAIVLHFYTRQ